MIDDNIKDLGLAVLKQAYDDACRKKSKSHVRGYNYKTTDFEIQTARSFLRGDHAYNRKWLNFWCACAGIDPKRIMRESRAKWKK